MRTSLNDIQQAEAYLSGSLSHAEAAVFEARMLTSPLIAENVRYQQQVCQFIQAFGRTQLRAELEAIHTSLFTAKEHISFRKRIWKIFRNK